jgi:hypothetical protein
MGLLTILDDRIEGALRSLLRPYLSCDQWRLAFSRHLHQDDRAQRLFAGG